MALLRLRLYRLNSPLQYLRRGRGLGRLRDTLELVIAHDSEEAQDAYTHLIQAGDPVRDITHLLSGPADNIIRIVGMHPGKDDLHAFTVPITYSDSKRGPRELIRLTDPQTGIPTGTEFGPPISRIDILYVDDWLQLLRKLEKELEAEIRNGTAEPRDRALHERLTDLQFDDYSRSHFNRIFSFTGNDWTGVSVSDIVNADTGTATASINGSQIEVKTILRKPGGGRFGKVTFDFDFDEFGYGSFTQGITFRVIARHDVGEVEFDFSRPGLLSVNKENREELSELFQSVWIEQALEQRIRDLEAEISTAFGDLWQEIMTEYPANLPYSHQPEVAFTRGGLADETLTRLTMTNGFPIWRNLQAKRPYLTGCIIRHRMGTLLVNPG